MPASDPSDPADVIAAALARLRGRRGPRPWDGRGADGMPPWMHGTPHAGPHAGHHGGTHADQHGGMGHRPGGVPPWGGHTRFAGPARLRLLEALSSASHPLTVSEVADAIGVDQPRASRLVQQSVDLGVVRREADPDDARRTRIVLTDEGSALVRGFRGDRREAIDGALAGFSDAERAEMARLLTKLAEAWPR